ncbi:SusD family protein [Salinivirga cyanobacteriivorans]|uniref:SusD family protein n=1 Tax=Salinivirga cyanobacteriivorans TaxID=1307839 RepID=A0A0S2I2K3_9BACT|nr:RagB/SusD family nutrient uptake outer membrane protein [Salinivirga cyanobacteriivorans]ALO16442.1 SusD family protein [Salinivirga cyanobacteriivorans]
MKSIKYIFITLVLLSSGCADDWLELEPVGQKLESNFYQTEEDIYKGLIAAYSMLQPKYWENYGSYYFLANFPSDDSEVVGGGPGDRPEYHAVAEFTMLPTNSAILEMWRRDYYGVYRTNVVIANANPNASQASREYIAEAKFLRAYYYSELVKFFGAVPLITSTLTPDEYNQERKSPAQVYAQIVKDLQDAIPNLAENPVEDYRVTKGAAQALLGKTYLYMASPYYYNNYNFELSQAEYYQLAADQFNEVIISAQYDLEPNYDNIWKLSHEHGIESIFEIEYSDINRGGDWGNGRVNGGNIDVQLCGPRGIATDTLNAGWGFDMVTQDLIGEYNAEGDNIRKEGTAYGEAFLTLIGAEDWDENEGYTGWFSKKRAPWAHIVGDVDAQWNYETNERIIRYADVLLMMAEAIVGGATAPQSADYYLNLVRDRVELDPISGVTMDDIKKERRLELAMEGHRFFDLVRWGDAATVLGDRGFVQGKHEVFPIPQEEIVNSNYALTQNPNY